VLWQTDLTIEMFWAPPWSGTRALVSWLDLAYAPRDDLLQRAEAAAFTEHSKLLAVAEGDDRFTWWSFPRGRREPGESIEDTLRRELLEEACAQVMLSERLGFQRFSHLNGERAGRVTTDAMFWARVEARPFAPEFETRARRELSLGAARPAALGKSDHPTTADSASSGCPPGTLRRNAFSPCIGNPSWKLLLVAAATDSRNCIAALTTSARGSPCWRSPRHERVSCYWHTTPTMAA
jgi:ADP-ribose pyrophosphatase YjhB (NUDIX family)